MDNSSLLNSNGSTPASTSTAFKAEVAGTPTHKARPFFESYLKYQLRNYSATLMLQTPSGESLRLYITVKVTLYSTSQLHLPVSKLIRFSLPSVPKLTSVPRS